MSPPPPIATTSPAVTEASLLPPIASGRSPAILLAMLAYVLVYFATCLAKHRFYLYDDFDLAIFTQALSELRHGSWFSSIRGMNWLGDHSSLILVPLLPLFALAPSPLTLLAVQTVALALGAIPVYRLAHRALGTANAARAFAIVYLLQPALGYVNLFEFHPEALATPLLLAAFDATHARRYGRALGWATAALLAKEDVALVVGALALWAVATTRPRPWRFGAGAAALAVASMAVTLLALKPLAAGEADYGAMYRQWGDSLPAVVRGVATHPLQALAALVGTPDHPVDTRLKLELWLHLLLPVAFLALASPGALAIALPVLAAHLLSWRSQQHTIVFQYASLIVPFVMAAAVLGARRLAHRVSPRDPGAGAQRLAWLAVGAAMIGQATFGPFAPLPLLQTYRAAQRVTPTRLDVAMAPHRDRMLARLDRELPIVAGFEFLPRLATASRVHSLHHVLSGHYTFSSKPYPSPQRAQVIADLAGARMLPFVDAAGIERLRRLSAAMLLGDGVVRPGAHGADSLPTWIAARGDLIALVWAAPAHPRAGAAGPEGPSGGRRARGWPVALDPSASSRRSILYDGVLACLGATAVTGAYEGQPTLVIRTRWRRVGEATEPYLLQWRLRFEAGSVAAAGTHVLGYGIDGPGAWPPGATARDDLIVPFAAPSRRPLGAMEIRVARWRSGRLVSAAGNDPDISQRDGWFPIARASQARIDLGGETMPPPR